MVLADLGAKITGAFSKLNRAPIIDDELLDEVLKEIAAALLQADVNVKYVSELRSNVKKRVLMESDAGGLNKRKLIQKVLWRSWCGLFHAIVIHISLRRESKTSSC